MQRWIAQKSNSGGLLSASVGFGNWVPSLTPLTVLLVSVRLYAPTVCLSKRTFVVSSGKETSVPFKCPLHWTNRQGNPICIDVDIYQQQNQFFYHQTNALEIPATVALNPIPSMNSAQRCQPCPFKTVPAWLDESSKQWTYPANHCRWKIIKGTGYFLLRPMNEVLQSNMTQFNIMDCCRPERKIIIRIRPTSQAKLYCSFEALSRQYVRCIRQMIPPTVVKLKTHTQPFEQSFKQAAGGKVIKGFAW